MNHAPIHRYRIDNPCNQIDCHQPNRMYHLYIHYSFDPRPRVCNGTDQSLYYTYPVYQLCHRYSNRIHRNPNCWWYLDSNRVVYIRYKCVRLRVLCTDTIHQPAPMHIPGILSLHQPDHNYTPRKPGNCRTLLCNRYTFDRRNYCSTYIDLHHYMKHHSNRAIDNYML